MKRIRVSVGVVCLILGFGISGWGQNMAPSAAGTPPLQQTVVPHLIKFSGTLHSLAGKPVTGPVDVTFSLYSNETSGAALWFETQTVQADSLGNYTVLLGAMTPAGVPMELFTEGEARWLGVQVTNLPEQPRVLLVSVPYAMKAGDAETLGGRPASAFMLASQAANETAAAASAGTLSGLAQARALTSGGTTPKAVTITTSYIPMFASGTGTLTNSVMFQSGARIGVNTSAPAASLDVNGAVFIVGTATAAAGQGGTMRFRDDTGTQRWLFGLPGSAGSQDFQMYNYTNGHAPLFIQNGAASYSLYLSGTGNVGVGTNSPAAKLDVNGTAKFSGAVTLTTGVTGNLKINGAGNALIFPDGTVMSSAGTGGGVAGGTITGVTPGVGLAGGGTAGNVTLNLDTALVPTFATGSNVFSGSITASAFAGDGSGLTNVNAATLGGMLPSAFQPVGVYATLGGNAFSATQTITSGDVSVSAGNLDLPATSASAAGVITLGGSPFAHAYGTENTFLGSGAGNFGMTGAGANTGFGYHVLQNNTTGVANTASGGETLSSNTTGGANTAMGFSTLHANTTGSNNSASGYYGLHSNTTGSQNDASGSMALWNNTSGSQNTAHGMYALQTNNDGSGNTAVGYNSLGGNCMNSVTDCPANYNTAVGFQAGSGIGTHRSGASDTYIGANSGPGSATPYNNATAIGANAVVGTSNALVLGSINGLNGATASVNVGIGTATPAYALDVVGDVRASGVFRGDGSGLTNVSASSSTTASGLSCTGCVGNTQLGVNYAASASKGGAATNALLLNGLASTAFASIGANSFSGTQTVSAGNVQISAGNLNLPATSPAGTAGVITLGGVPFAFGYAGSGNTFIGLQAGNLSMAGSTNSAGGYHALASNTFGNQNTAFGSMALSSNTTGDYNTAVGALALIANTTGFFNTATGVQALYSNNIGQYNTADGYWALVSNTIGEQNTADGFEALRDNLTGNNNTALGFEAGYTKIVGNSNVTGSDNTFLGAYSGPASSTQISNATAIGAYAAAGASNVVTIGAISGVNGASASVNVGIGTTTPAARLQVANGDVYASQAGSGVIVKSPDGTKCARIGIDNSGALSVSSITCP